MKGPSTGRRSSPETSSPKRERSKGAEPARMSWYKRGKRGARGRAARRPAAGRISRVLDSSPGAMGSPVFIASRPGTDKARARSGAGQTPSAELTESIPRHRLVVVVQALRELVATIVQRHEVKVVDSRRMRRRADGRQPRVGDGSWWQAGSPVGVVRVVHEQIIAREGLAPLAGGVLHRRVGLKRHIELEPVPEYGRDQRQLLRIDRFTLDDGGEGQELVDAEAQLSGRVQEVRSQLSAHLHHHARQHLLWCDPFGELISVGKEITLDRRAGYLERSKEEGVVANPNHIVGAGQPFGLDGARQLGQREAFPQEHGMVEDLAAFEKAQHGEGVGSLRDRIFGGLEAPCLPLREGKEREAERASDDVGLVEASRNVEHAQVGRDFDDAGAGRHRGRGGDEQPALEPDEEAAENNDRPDELPKWSAGLRPGAGRALEKTGPFHHDSFWVCAAFAGQVNFSP